ncbi:MAG: ferritin [Candidatus Latescibacterota bacterium]|nr:MAG: ferritin [Candidatus Latescibacterota bacterium]
MLKKSMEKALNKQMNDEFASAYLYLSMAAYFETKNLKGFAAWMHAQAKEESGHAMKFFHHMLDRGGKPILAAIDEPPAAWKSPLDAFQNVLAHERLVTAGIHKLLELADKESDHPAHAFLQWFVTEQVEEEATAEGIVQKVKMIGDMVPGIFMMDRELAQRQG